MPTEVQSDEPGAMWANRPDYSGLFFKEYSLEDRETIDKFHKLFFKSWNKYPRIWTTSGNKGVRIVKYPQDMLLYHMVIAANKPDIVIETGSFMGGGASFFASMCAIIGHGEVISVDRRDIVGRPKHPFLTYVIGRCTAVDTLEKVRGMVVGKSVMVVLDSDHRTAHVKRELRYYSQMVTKGQFLVVEDTMLGRIVPWKYGWNKGPYEAVKWFMEGNKDFEDMKFEERYLISMSPGGWLRRVK